MKLRVKRRMFFPEDYSEPYLVQMQEDWRFLGFWGTILSFRYKEHAIKWIERYPNSARSEDWPEEIVEKVFERTFLNETEKAGRLTLK